MWFKSIFTTPAVVAMSFCLIGGTSSAAADILHVPGDFPTIQAGIDAAVDGDEVVVAPGTYNENINFLGKAITLRSSDGSGVTTIDAAGDGGSVVVCLSREGADTVLDGFTITGGFTDLGGGMFNYNSSPTVVNCTFLNNVASLCHFNCAGHGGGMFNEGGSPTVTNCTFRDNGANFGGGMANFNSSPTVTNCTFTGNTAAGGFGPIGGGMCNIGGNPTVTNCTFEGNIASEGGGIANGNSDSTITNCILWGDSPNEIWDQSGTIAVTYSNVQGGWPGTGNIDADPLFVAPGSGDYRLSSGSPCIDAADNTAVPMGIDTDLDGNPRFVDDPDTEDTGFGDPPIVDMGAYEFQVMGCPWDINGDGVVDHRDLLEVVHNMGQCDDPDNCPWDVNGDGIVNGHDVAAVATHFGACP